MTQSFAATVRPALALGLALALPPSAASAGWSTPMGGAGSTNRASGTALITGDAANSPGIAWSIARSPQPLSSAELRDLDGDGVAEVVFIGSGKVWALSPLLASAAWVSPAQSIDGLVGYGELDGDPSSQELVASSSTTGGGFLIINPEGGGVLGSLGPFPTLSGAASNESVLADLDGDGIDEILHPPGRFSVNSMWVSTLGSGVSSPGFLEVPLGGYANFTPAFVGDFLATGDPVVVVDQGPGITLYPTCEPTAADAVCDDAAGTVCLCAPLSVIGVHANYAFGLRWIMDTDDDGHDELVQVGFSAPYIKSMAVLDFADGFAGGTGDVSALHQWYRRYNGPSVRMEPFREGPIDLDGDGDLELIASFYDNDGSDSDSLGTTPNDDGIDHPGAVSVGVFDLATGEPLMSVLDGVAWGTTDLDGNGILELVTSPTSGFAFQDGLSGWELDCSTTPCTVTQVWSAPSHSLDPLLDTFSNNGLPIPKLFTVDTDGDGIGELLAYDGTTLDALTADGAGGVSSLASRLLLPDEVVLAADGDTNSAVLTSATNATVLDSDLSTIGAAMRLPAVGWQRFHAASFDGGTREAPVFSGRVFMSDETPATIADGDHTLLPGFGLAEDLDGDGAAELVSYANPGSLDNDDDSFEIRLDRWDTNTSAFVPVWEFDSEDYQQFTGFVVQSELHWASGDFDGTGSRDIVVEFGGGGVYHYAVIDGDTGDLDATLTAAQRVATSSGLLVADLVDANGNPAPDGIDDLLIDGAQIMSLHTIAQGELWNVTVGGFIHGVGSYADTDGDGQPELIATLSVTTNNQIEVIDDLASPTPAAAWGPSPLPLPTDQVQVMAIADLDAVLGLDVLYAGGDGGVQGFSGATGAPVAGLPVYLAAGAFTTTPPPSAANLQAMISLDVDDDGYEEAIVGAADGWIYAVNVSAADPEGPGLVWSFSSDAAVRALAAADTDGDGYDEILVSTDNGTGSVLDGLGVAVNITSPTGVACIPSTVFEVTGTAVGVATVEVLVGGSSISGDVGASSGSWIALAEARGSGTFALVARGKDSDGVITAYATRLILVGDDVDEDGWFACADCDDEDAERYPEAEDVCDDGIDQDCDGVDASCGDDDDSAGDDDDSSPGDDDDDDDSAVDPTGCAGCDGCSATPQSGGSAALLLFGAVLALRRRRD